METASRATRTFPQAAFALVRIFLGKREVVHIDKIASLEQIRRQLQTILGSTDHVGTETVRAKVEAASDIQQLWYLRADVMDAVAKKRGESAAKCELNALNESFRQLLPKGLVTRPSPLES